MRPAPFELLRPTSKAEALSAMSRGAVPFAGGQTLLQAMRLGQKTPQTLVDLSGISGLSDSITQIDERILVGARVTHRQFIEHSLINQHLPWLAQAAAKIGDVQVRNLGTVLGNLCWADPRANMAVAMMAGDANVIATGDSDPESTVKIPLSEFFTGYQQNSLGSRLACGIELPLHANAQGVYLEFSRQPQDLALCNVCVVHDGQQWRVAVGGIAERAVRVLELEEKLSLSQNPDFLNALASNSNFVPPIDAFGGRAFKMQLAATLIRRAVDKLRTV